MSLFTKWACFDCRKSFAKEPVKNGEPARICPDCRKPMIDMGFFFEPPRKLNVKRWQIMRILADNEIKFQTAETKNYVQNFILQAKNPRVADVLERIEAERQKVRN